MTNKTITHLLIFHFFSCLQQPMDNVSNEEVEVDIDELLDMDSDEERRTHLQVNKYFNE